MMGFELFLAAVAEIAAMLAVPHKSFSVRMSE
jgi:hypothetical protein